MNESLAQMVKDTTDVDEKVSIPELDLPVETVAQEKEETVQGCVTPTNMISLPLTTLNKWFDKNVSSFPNINQVKVAIRGIDPQETLIVSSMKLSGEMDAEGNVKRELHIFENANEAVVIDLPAVDMQIYNNGFRVIYEHNGMFIKAYGVKSGLICTLCKNVEGELIPYSIPPRASKRDTIIDFGADIPNVEEKLNLNADLESLQLLYKQSKKAVASLTTNISVIKWLNQRLIGIIDVNHHLQIDGVIIDLLK